MNKWWGRKKKMIKQNKTFNCGHSGYGYACCYNCDILKNGMCQNVEYALNETHEEEGVKEGIIEAIKQHYQELSYLIPGRRKEKAVITHGECYDRGHGGNCNIKCSIFQEGDCDSVSEEWIIDNLKRYDKDEMEGAIEAYYPDYDYLLTDNKKEINKMNKVIEKLYPVTKEANLIEKHFGGRFEEPAFPVLLAGKEKQLLEAAQLLEIELELKEGKQLATGV